MKIENIFGGSITKVREECRIKTLFPTSGGSGLRTEQAIGKDRTSYHKEVHDRNGRCQVTGDTKLLETLRGRTEPSTTRGENVTGSLYSSVCVVL